MRTLLFLLAACFAGGLSADSLTFEIRGLEGAPLTNARNSLETLEVSDKPPLGQRRMNRIREEAERRVTVALKPFGFYQARVESRVIGEDQPPRSILLDVEPGPPVRVTEADVRLSGPGAELAELREWLADWPLQEGSILHHGRWQSAKQEALDLLDYRGYLKAEFTEHRIELDLARNEATLKLYLDTGPRAVMGEVRFEQEVVRDSLLQRLPRFESGQPYDGWLLEKLRQDLWRTGFYSTIDVVENRQLERDPPVVDIDARLAERNRDTWEGLVGAGSDTEARAQLNWTRHWLSERGDSLGIGLGWQQRDNRYLARTNYRLPRLIGRGLPRLIGRGLPRLIGRGLPPRTGGGLPRHTSRRSYWIAETLYRDEKETLEVSPQEQPDTIFELANGSIENYLFKSGMLNIRDLREGYQQISETWFVQYLRENVNFGLPGGLEPSSGEGADPQFRRLFSDDNSSIAIGVEWDWPVIRGQGFETVGHHQQVRLFTANEAWASDREFSQIYLSSRWNFMAGERIKLLLRAEVGYSDAEVDEFDLEVEGDVIRISLTELPNLYRFKAGGSQNVRGYSFESLSDNGIGSNNILTFSAEAEWLFRENWSVAAFYDVGNAFNDWDETELRQGAGLGIRWYSIAGPVRLDFASGLDLPGDPWRIHFTVGVPLL